MVQILPKVESFGSSFGKAIGGSLGEGFSEGYHQGQETKKKFAEMKKENDEAKKLGIDLSGFITPEHRKIALTEGLKGINEQKKYGEELQRNEPILRKLEKDRDLEPNSLDPYKNDVKMAEQVSRPQKTTSKTQASQPIDPEQLAIIKNIRKSNEYKKANPLEKYQIMTDNGVSKENAQAEADIASKESDITEKNRVESRKEQLVFHKESSEYDDELLKNSKSAKIQLDAIKDTEQSLASGNIKPTSLSNIFRGFGDIGNKISNALLNKDESTLLASIPAFLEGRKELFGVRLSDADLKLLQDKLPDIGKSEASNRTILNMMKKYSERSILKSKIGSQIKKENKGLRPLGYSDQVEEEYDRLTAPVKIKNPHTGNVVEIPAYDVSKYVEDGGIIINE